MFLNEVSDFCEFLATKTHSIEEILAHITLRVFSPLNASTTFICELNSQNLVESLGVFGLGKGLEDKYPNLYSFHEPLPVPDAMRKRKVLWINTLPKWPDEYPALKDAPEVKGAKTFICFPIEKCGTPVAAVGLFCNAKIDHDSETETFLKAIGNVLALHLYREPRISDDKNGFDRNLKSTNSNSGSVSRELTDRQSLVLRLISESRTNSAIGELLGYSESTVRQETIKIFAKMRCSGREEASRIYRDLQKPILKE